MRRSVLRRAVLPASAAVVLLAGCTDSAEDEPTATDETSAAETTTPTDTPTEEPADSAFCTEAVSIQERISGSASSGDPGQLPQLFREAADEIRAIDPPEEIAQDWTALAEGAEEFASTLGDVDLTDPQALATLQERLAPLEQELNAASTSVQNYLAEECGVGGSVEESAPSS
ncbi:hypothetical protein [Blastococcus saxobsidens]|uniref:Uncharacterized protein n=1 Tax=Blastococcus saxobsidens (strain DD2) TaxID=1146883 RepID=H6RRE8_BLASD|nr:hypothetical protein [Blastococcus saxobsidens]CCG05430.1 exported protein of unknown function [Blastococcus saxobsidens DD2]